MSTTTLGGRYHCHRRGLRQSPAPVTYLIRTGLGFNFGQPGSRIHALDLSLLVPDQNLAYWSGGRLGVQPSICNVLQLVHWTDGERSSDSPPIRTESM